MRRFKAPASWTCAIRSTWNLTLHCGRFGTGECFKLWFLATNESIVPDATNISNYCSELELQSQSLHSHAGAYAATDAFADGRPVWVRGLIEAGRTASERTYIAWCGSIGAWAIVTDVEHRCQDTAVGRSAVGVAASTPPHSVAVWYERYERFGEVFWHAGDFTIECARRDLGASQYVHLGNPVAGKVVGGAWSSNYCCEAGFRVDTESNTCVACPIGSFSSQRDSIKCTCCTPTDRTGVIDHWPFCNKDTLESTYVQASTSRGACVYLFQSDGAIHAVFVCTIAALITYATFVAVRGSRDWRVDRRVIPKRCVRKLERRCCCRHSRTRREFLVSALIDLPSRGVLRLVLVAPVAVTCVIVMQHFVVSIHADGSPERPALGRPAAGVLIVYLVLLGLSAVVVYGYVYRCGSTRYRETIGGGTGRRARSGYRRVTATLAAIDVVALIAVVAFVANAGSARMSGWTSTRVDRALPDGGTESVEISPGNSPHVVSLTAVVLALALMQGALGIYATGKFGAYGMQLLWGGFRPPPVDDSDDENAVDPRLLGLFEIVLGIEDEKKRPDGGRGTPGVLGSIANDPLYDRKVWLTVREFLAGRGEGEGANLPWPGRRRLVRRRVGVRRLENRHRLSHRRLLDSDRGEGVPFQGQAVTLGDHLGQNLDRGDIELTDVGGSHWDRDTEPVMSV